MKQRDFIAVMMVLLAGSIGMLWSMTCVRQASFGADAPTSLVPRRGMYGSEQFPQQDVSYRWTKGTSMVQVPYPGNASVVSLVLAGGSGRTVPVTLHVEPSITHDISFLVAPAPRTYTLLLPPAPTERVSVQITAPTMRDPRNGQKLGLVVSTISVQGAGHLHWTWVGAGWLVLLALYAVARHAGGSPWLAAGIALVDLVVLLFWHVSLGWLYGITTMLLGVQGGVLAAGWLASLAMKRDDLLVSVLLTVVSILVFVPVMAVQVLSSGDYMVHIGEAARMLRTGTLGFPHFLFQMCLLDMYVLFPPGFDQVSLYAITGVLPGLVGDVGVYKETSGLEVPAMITGVLLAWVTVVVIYRYVVSMVSPIHTRTDKLVVVLVVVLVMMATPVTLFRWLGLDSLSYLGYIGTHAYHNPTFNLIKPIALVLFWFAMLPFSAEHVNRKERKRRKDRAAGQFDGYHRSPESGMMPNPIEQFPSPRTPSTPRRHVRHVFFRYVPAGELGMHWYRVLVGATAALTALSALAKPSYILCLVPALMLGTLYRLVRRQPVDWVLLGGGVLLPASMMLVWQYLFTYASAGPTTMKESGIILAPFETMSLYSSWLLPKFLLSIIFPVCVYVLYARQALASIGLNVAWLSFFVGAFFAYGVSETGERSLHGNFLWSAHIALFVLFVVSVAFVIRQYRAHYEGALYRMLLVDRRASVCLAVLGVHSISGIDYYLRALGGNVW